MSNDITQLTKGSSESNPQQGAGSGVPTPDADMISKLKADLHAADQTIQRQKGMILTY